MSIEEHIEKFKEIQAVILEFLENETNSDENFSNLKNIIDEQKICSNKQEFILFLHLISSISKNHFRGPYFISKIEKVLDNYAIDIKQNLTNSEIFDIFKGSKRVLLFLFEKRLIYMDKKIFETITSQKYKNFKYPQYFLPEIQSFINNECNCEFKQKLLYRCIDEWINEIEKEFSEDFYKLRKEGENENYICELIRNDLVKEFIIYENRLNYSLESDIVPSIYETHPFLIHMQNCCKLTIIKYAAFFGSIQILKYLQMKGVALTSDLWLYSIHGNNADIIHLLEENNIIPKEYYTCSDSDFEYIHERCLNEAVKCFNESIKCHHNDIANYLLDNYIKYFTSSIYRDCFKSYNFAFIMNEFISESVFIYLVQYDYYLLIELLLTNEDFDVSQIFKSYD